MGSVWTTKEPLGGNHFRREDGRVCRYVEQKLHRSVLPTVTLRMACGDEEPVRVAGGAQYYYPEPTEEDVTCTGCLTTGEKPPARGAVAASWNSRFRPT